MLFAVGTYTHLGGPGVALIRAEGKNLQWLCASDAVKDPTWVMQSPHAPHILYVTGAEDGQGVVASYAWTENALTLLSCQPTGGQSCCHLAVDADETHLYAANYGDGSVSVFPLEAGKIGPCCQFLRHEAPLGPNTIRQNCSHAHQCMFRPGTQELFVCNLGTDQVLVYNRQADGLLELKETIPGKAGTGPRHLHFEHADHFYLVGELSGWISSYVCDQGIWQCEQILSTLPEGYSDKNSAAAIRLDEKRVYVSNRGPDNIALFDRLADGKLAPAGHVPVPGCFPRDFQLWENGFLLAQQNAGGVAWMDAQGVAGQSLPIDGAVCLCPLNEK